MVQWNSCYNYPINILSVTLIFQCPCFSENWFSYLVFCGLFEPTPFRLYTVVSFAQKRSDVGLDFRLHRSGSFLRLCFSVLGFISCLKGWLSYGTVIKRMINIDNFNSKIAVRLGLAKPFQVGSGGGRGNCRHPVVINRLNFTLSLWNLLCTRAKQC